MWLPFVGAQLGFNVAVVERAEQEESAWTGDVSQPNLLLKSAQVLEYAQHAEAYGIRSNMQSRFSGNHRP